jgi:glycosyltransferase involved in cell wall biosynthesis
MSKIRVLVIPSDPHGVGKFRALDPYKYIGTNFSDDVHVDIVMDAPNDDSYFLDYDVVALHSFIHKTSHENNVIRINWLKANGIKVIVDIDDFWSVDQRHPMYQQIIQTNTAAKKIEILKLADYVTTTTPLFADVIKSRLNLKNILVFPNAVDETEPQFTSKKTESEFVRFGWLGGSSHLHDIELMRNGISSTHNSYKGKVQFVLCGFDTRGTVTSIDKATGKTYQRQILPEETVWKTYEDIFTDKYSTLSPEYINFLNQYREDETYNDLNQPYRRRWTKNVSTYASNYNNFDVSLSPLVDSFFNSCKSQLKVIEAGFHKKALIASEVNPYLLDLKNAVNNGNFTDGNALLVSPNKNHKDWAKHMKRLIENPNMIEDLGNRLYETVKDTYSLKKVCQDRVQFLKNIK